MSRLSGRKINPGLHHWKQIQIQKTWTFSYVNKERGWTFPTMGKALSPYVLFSKTSICTPPPFEDQKLAPLNFNPYARMTMQCQIGYKTKTFLLVILVATSKVLRQASSNYYLPTRMNNDGCLYWLRCALF